MVARIRIVQLANQMNGGLVLVNNKKKRGHVHRFRIAERQRSQEGFAGPPWMREHGRRGHGWEPQMQALRSEVAETARLFITAGRAAMQNPEKLARLRSIMERTRTELTALIYGDDSGQQ